jgi:hypothetical protein
MSHLLNIGTISKIEIARASQVFTTMPTTTGIVSIVGSPSWNEVDHTFESASLNQVESFVNEGVKFVTTASWIKPKICSENTLSAISYINIPIALKITDANGVVYIIGNESNPAYIQFNINIPKEAAGLNHYLFNVVHASAYPLAILG